MSIFDEQAIEAGALALDAEFGKQQGNLATCVAQNVHAAILAMFKRSAEAATASLRERGKLRAGHAYQTDSTSKGWHAYDDEGLHEDEFPVVIIRIEEEPITGKFEMSTAEEVAWNKDGHS